MYSQIIIKKMIIEENKPESENADKILVEDLIKDFKISNIDNFTIYIRDIWKV